MKLRPLANKRLMWKYGMLYRPITVSPGCDPDEVLLMVFTVKGKRAALKAFQAYKSNGFRDMRFINLQKRLMWDKA